MFFSGRRTLRKKRAARIAELQQRIDEAWAKSTSHEEAIEISKSDENELEHLQQIETMQSAEHWAINIPDDHYSGEEWPYHVTLTDAGLRWTRREVRRAQLAFIKSYFDVFVPILSLLIALIALLKK